MICVLLVLLNNNFLFCFIGYTFVLTNLFVHTELLLGSDLSCYEKGRRCLSEILNQTPNGDQSGHGPSFFDS